MSVFFKFPGRIGTRTQREETRSFPEKGVPSDAVQQVMGLPLGRLGQQKHLLLRHAGWNGDVTLVKRVKVLVMWWDGTRVTNACGKKDKIPHYLEVKGLNSQVEYAFLPLFFPCLARLALIITCFLCSSLISIPVNREHVCQSQFFEPVTSSIFFFDMKQQLLPAELNIFSVTHPSPGPP